MMTDDRGNILADGGSDPKPSDPESVVYGQLDEHLTGGSIMLTREELAKRLMQVELRNRRYHKEMIDRKHNTQIEIQSKTIVKEKEVLIHKQTDEIKKLQQALEDVKAEMRSKEITYMDSIHERTSLHQQALDAREKQTQKNDELRTSIDGLRANEFQLRYTIKDLEQAKRDLQIEQESMKQKLNVVTREKEKLLKASGSIHETASKVKTLEKDLKEVMKFQSICQDFWDLYNGQGPNQKIRRLLERYRKTKQNVAKLPDVCSLLKEGCVTGASVGMDGDDMGDDDDIDISIQPETPSATAPVAKAPKVVRKPTAQASRKGGSIGSSSNAIAAMKKRHALAMDPRLTAVKPTLNLDLQPVDRRLLLNSRKFGRMLWAEVTDMNAAPYQGGPKISRMKRVPLPGQAALPRRKAPGTSTSQDVVPTRVASRPSKPQAPTGATGTGQPEVRADPEIVNEVLQYLVGSVVNATEPAAIASPAPPDIGSPPRVSKFSTPSGVKFAPFKTQSVPANKPSGVPGVKSRMIVPSPSARNVSAVKKAGAVFQPAASKSQFDLSNIIRDMQMGQNHIPPVKENTGAVAGLTQTEQEHNHVAQDKDNYGGMDAAVDSDDSEAGLVIDDTAVPKIIDQDNSNVGPDSSELPPVTDDAAVPKKARGRPKKRRLEEEQETSPAEKIETKKVKKVKDESPSKGYRPAVRTKSDRAAHSAKLPVGITLMPMGASHHVQVAKRAQTSGAKRNTEITDECTKKVYSTLELIASTGPEKLATQLNAALEKTPEVAAEILSKYVCLGLSGKCGDILARLKHSSSPPSAPFMAENEHRFLEVLAEMINRNSELWSDLYGNMTHYLLKACFQLSCTNDPQFLSSLRCLIALCARAANTQLVTCAMQHLLQTRQPHTVVPAFVFISSVNPEVFASCFEKLAEHYRFAFAYHMNRNKGQLMTKRAKVLIAHYAPHLDQTIIDNPPQADLKIRLAKMSYLNCHPLFAYESTIKLTVVAQEKLDIFKLLLISVERERAIAEVKLEYAEILKDITRLSKKEQISMEHLAAKFLLVHCVVSCYSPRSTKLYKLLKLCCHALHNTDVHSKKLFKYAIYKLFRDSNIFQGSVNYGIDSLIAKIDGSE